MVVEEQVGDPTIGGGSRVGELVRLPNPADAGGGGEGEKCKTIAAQSLHRPLRLPC